MTSERSGCGWMSAFISETHRQLSGGISLYWDFEISRIIGIDKKYYLPIGHCSIYYVRLEWLLKRNYDKIIVLHRALDTFKKKMYNYYLPELSESEILEQYPQWIEQMDFYHDLTFSNKTENERVLQVELSDLNNYTISEFNRILDFLGYPMETEEEKKGKIYIRQRPCFIPVNTEERDFEVSASCLSKGIMIGPRSHEMLKHSNKDVLAPIERPELQKHPEMTPYNCMRSTGQHTSLEKANPFKISPEEWKHQNHRAYRIIPEGGPDILKILKLI